MAISLESATDAYHLSQLCDRAQNIGLLNKYVLTPPPVHVKSVRVESTVRAPRQDNLQNNRARLRQTYTVTFLRRRRRRRFADITGRWVLTNQHHNYRAYACAPCRRTILLLFFSSDAVDAARARVVIEKKTARDDDDDDDGPGAE